MRMTLRAIRINKGLSVKEASDGMGIKKETLRNYEAFRTIPSADSIIKILKFYNMKFENLILLPSDHKTFVKRSK